MSDGSGRIGRSFPSLPAAPREASPLAFGSSPPSPFQPVPSTSPIYDKSTSSPTGGAGLVVFAVNMNRKSFSPERRNELRIGRLLLFLLNLFGVRRGAISFVKLAQPSFFLLFQAGQFFPSLFALISSGSFRQNFLLRLKIKLSRKEKEIHRNLFPGNRVGQDRDILSFPFRV